MKLQIGDKVYLQKYELIEIMAGALEVPQRVTREILFRNSIRQFKIKDCTDSWKFKFVFKDPKNVEWLMEQDWLLNFDEYSKKSIEELNNLRDQLTKEYCKCVDAYNAECDAGKVENSVEIRIGLDKIEHKLNSLDDIIKYLNNECIFTFPRQYRTGTQIKPSFFARLTGRSAQ